MAAPFPVKLAAPAQRALSNAGISTLQQLAKLTETDFAKLHGIGPNAIKQIKKAMKEQGLSFASRNTSH